jgi:hypothetical protein
MPIGWTTEQAAPSENTSDHRDWHIFANISYTSRTLDGSVNNRSAIADDVFGDLVASGDSMNLDTSQTLMYTLGVRHRRWGLGLNYAPTSFSGQGYAIVTLSGGAAGVLQKTPLNTDIDVNLLLGRLTYDVVQTGASRFGIGAGLGKSYIDLNIIPQVGDSIIYDGNQPFGYFSIYMSSTHNGFLYGDEVEYSDYTIDLGYRLSDKEIKWDIVGGYRLVNFSIDIEDGNDMVKAITHLQGPFIGISITY